MLMDDIDPNEMDEMGPNDDTSPPPSKSSKMIPKMRLKLNSTCKDAEVRHDDFSEPDDLRDFAFRVEDKVLYLNAMYLSVQSPVFRVMTQGNFREAQEKTAELRDKHYEDILELFRCIYPCPISKKVDDRNVDMLLEMAREYQLTDLKQRCTDFLHEKFEEIKNNPREAMQILQIAAEHELPELVAKCLPTAAQLSLEKIDALSKVLPISVVASLYQAKAYKYRDTVQPTVGPKTHVYGETKFIVQGASRRKCEGCSVAGSSKHMDKCIRCRKVLCEACKENECTNNAYIKCSMCKKELRVGIDNSSDSCRCKLAGFRNDFLNYDSSSTTISILDSSLPGPSSRLII